MASCSTCDREAVILLKHSGQKFCQRCFARSVEKRVQNTISKYNMFTPTDRIAVAVSGGKDSVSLLHILHKIETGFPKSKILAITIDEGIAGYRDEAVQIAAENCKKLGIEHIVSSFKELYGYDLDDVVEAAEDKGGLSACTYCGVLRRKALNVAARRVGAEKLATAHTLDDETQTILLNLLRGNVAWLARLEPVLEGERFVRRVKPLCEVPEAETAFYAFLKKVKFQSSTCPYMRSSTRNDVRAFLNELEMKHPGTKFAVYRSFEKVNPSVRVFADDIGLKECDVCGEPTVGQTCRACQVLLELGMLNR